VLSKAVNFYIPDGVVRVQLLGQIAFLPDVLPTEVTMDTKDEGEASEPKEKEEPRVSVIPEVEVYLSLLVLTTLLRQGETLAVHSLSAAQQLVLRCGEFNRRSLDLLRAKAFAYLGIAFERVIASTKTAQGSLRPILLAAHRTACLQHDEVGQATLLNLLLRSLLQENQVEQAFKLVSKTNFPEKASNNQFCRYLYYTGRIAALQVFLL
jgi:26S proteasome regulatory subunit N3